MKTGKHFKSKSDSQDSGDKVAKGPLIALFGGSSAITVILVVVLLASLVINTNANYANLAVDTRGYVTELQIQSTKKPVLTNLLENILEWEEGSGRFRAVVDVISLESCDKYVDETYVDYKEDCDAVVPVAFNIGGGKKRTVKINAAQQSGEYEFKVTIFEGGEEISSARERVNIG